VPSSSRYECLFAQAKPSAWADRGRIPDVARQVAPTWAFHANCLEFLALPLSTRSPPRCSSPPRGLPTPKRQTKALPLPAAWPPGDAEFGLSRLDRVAEILLIALATAPGGTDRPNALPKVKGEIMKTEPDSRLLGNSLPVTRKTRRFTGPSIEEQVLPHHGVTARHRRASGG
jgi:hypothetical protein